jgi:hypothetical protein
VARVGQARIGAAGSSKTSAQRSVVHGDALFGRGPYEEGPGPSPFLAFKSAWKMNSRKLHFRCLVFSEVE